MKTLPTPYWKITASTETTPTKILINGYIGSYGEMWGEYGVKELTAALKDVKGDVEVHINSGGGELFTGLAIYNILKTYNVNVVIDGLAGSIASIIAMAGKKVTMNLGTLMMIHDPLISMQGNPEALRKMADLLEKMGQQLADIYVAKSGDKISKERAIELMQKETWLTADEAIEIGLADAKGTETITAGCLDGMVFTNCVKTKVKQVGNSLVAELTDKAKLEQVTNDLETSKASIVSLTDKVKNLEAEVSTKQTEIDELAELYAETKLELEHLQDEVTVAEEKQAKVETIAGPVLTQNPEIKPGAHLAEYKRLLVESGTAALEYYNKYSKQIEAGHAKGFNW